MRNKKVNSFVQKLKELYGFPESTWTKQRDQIADDMNPYNDLVINRVETTDDRGKEKHYNKSIFHVPLKKNKSEISTLKTLNDLIYEKPGTLDETIDMPGVKDEKSFDIIRLET